MVAAALFAVFPFVFGKYQEVGIYREALASRELLVEDRQAALDNFTRERDKYETQLTGDTGSKFAAMVPTTRSTAELISSLDAIARQSGISLAGVSLGEARGTRGALTNSIQVTMEAEGSYSDFLDFLAAVEENVRLMDIQTLEVGGGDGGPLDFSVTLLAYFIQ